MSEKQELKWKFPIAVVLMLLYGVIGLISVGRSYLYAGFQQYVEVMMCVLYILAAIAVILKKPKVVAGTFAGNMLLQLFICIQTGFMRYRYSGFGGGYLVLILYGLESIFRVLALGLVAYIGWRQFRSGRNNRLWWIAGTMAALSAVLSFWNMLMGQTDFYTWVFNQILFISIIYFLADWLVEPMKKKWDV